MTDLLAIIVNFRDPEGAAACAHTFMDLLGRGQAWSGSVLVADNSAAESGLPHAAQPLRDAVNWLDTGGNLGYFGGARVALDRWVALHGQPRWVLVGNSDIRFRDPQFAVKLLEQDGTAVVAPQIRRDNQAGWRSAHLFENPFMQARPTAAWLGRRLWLCRHPRFYAVYDGLRSLSLLVARPKARPAGPIYAPHGALMALGHRFFEAGGELRPPAFLFAEELEVAEQALRLGLEVRFVPGMGALHEGSTTLGGVGGRRQAQWGAEALEAIRARYFADAPGRASAAPGRDA